MSNRGTLVVLSGSPDVFFNSRAKRIAHRKEEDIMSALQFTSPAPVVSRPLVNAPASVAGHAAPTAARPLAARPVSIKLAASRAFDSNPNHHLWKNGRLWWIAFTLIHDGYRQERVRQSLGTDNLGEARRRRDSILALFSRPTAEVNCCVDPDPDFEEFQPAVNG
jgi:hypothetical protein